MEATACPYLSIILQRIARRTLLWILLQILRLVEALDLGELMKKATYL
jgi:hypothetical protein